MDLIEYLSDAITRTERGDVASPSGSWPAGMFGKAANLFEKDISLHVRNLLEACNLRYPEDLVDVVKGNPPYEKLTFGQLLALMREAGKRHPEITANRTPTEDLKGFLEDLRKVNAAWVDTKHGSEFQDKILLKRMKTMLVIAKSLRATKSWTDV